MSIELSSDRAASQAAEPDYRAISPLAVTGFALSLISALALFDGWLLAILPALGFVTSLAGWRKVRREREFLTGERLALAGAAISVVFFISGASWQTYQYATEVPEGYQRISFDELQPDANRPGEIIPESSRTLEGQQVFIKGYVYPGRQTKGIKEFLLVWNNGDCCFGGQPPLTHMMKVQLQGDLEMDYSTRLRRVGGVFHVAPAEALEGLGTVVYQLDADYIQ